MNFIKNLREAVAEYDKQAGARTVAQAVCRKASIVTFAEAFSASALSKHLTEYAAQGCIEAARLAVQEGEALQHEVERLRCEVAAQRETHRPIPEEDEHWFSFDVSGTDKEGNYVSSNIMIPFDTIREAIALVKEVDSAPAQAQDKAPEDGNTVADLKSGLMKAVANFHDAEAECAKLNIMCDDLRTALSESRKARDMLRAKYERQVDRYAQLLAAVLPSESTKAAYSGEFMLTPPFVVEPGDADRCAAIPIPWPTIKDILNTIHAKGCPSEEAGERRPCGGVVEPVFISKAAVQWLANGERGASSDAIFQKLTGIDTLNGHFPLVPHDISDLIRCLGLLDAVPEFKGRMGEMATVSPAWARMAPVWDEIVSTFEAEAPNWRNESVRAPKTYDLMRSLIYAKEPH